MREEVGSGSAVGGRGGRGWGMIVMMGLGLGLGLGCQFLLPKGFFDEDLDVAPSMLPHSLFRGCGRLTLWHF
jgi:hypothetical protein